MADVCDVSQDRLEAMDEEAAIRIKKAAAAIPKGEPGVCQWCDGEFIRLVGGACGKCRDDYKLP
jgi:hypothetical protein